MKPFLSVAHLTLSWKWRHFSLLKAKCTYCWLITMCHAGHQLTGLAATFAMVTWTLACFGPWQVLNLLLFVGTRRFCSARVLEVFLQFAWKLLQSFSVTQCAVLSQCEADVSGFWLNNFWKEKKENCSCQLGLQCGMRYWYKGEAMLDPYNGSKDTSLLFFHYVAAMLHLRGIRKTHASLFTVRYSWLWSRGASVPRPVRNSGHRPGVEPPNIKWFWQEWDLSAVSVRGAVSWKPL